MATIDIDHRTVRVRFTRAEKIAGLLRDIDVPRSAVTSATVESDGLRAARGIRAPGLAVPAVRKIGTWRRRGHRTAVCVRRGEPALSLRLHGTRWDQLLIGTNDASSLAAQLSGD
jgi:hypothetical protein